MIIAHICIQLTCLVDFIAETGRYSSL